MSPKAPQKTKTSSKNNDYIFCKEVIRKDGSVIRPKKAKALRIPIAKLKHRKG